MRAAGWHFAPAGSVKPTRESLLGAAEAGPSALSRELRAARDMLGAARAAALLRAAESGAGHRFGRPMSVLLATTQQPRSLADALALSFAIAGFALDLRSIEGVQALRAALAGDAGAPRPTDFPKRAAEPPPPPVDDTSTPAAETPATTDTAATSFHGVRMSLLSMPDDGASAEREAMLSELAKSLAARTLAPVAIARFRLPDAGAAGSSVAAELAELARPASTGIKTLDIPVVTLFDRRFGGTFGAILTADAADRLADAAAGFAARLDGAAPKLVITDLDGTLWDGVLGEGSASILLHHAYADALKTLRGRGLVLAIASRNDPADIADALRQTAPLGPDAFAAKAVGWADKPALVAQILDELGLAPEHAVFIDDDPVNCAAVAARFPAMDVRHFADPDAFAAALLADPLLAGGAGGAERAQQYGRRAAVERLRHTAGDDAAFLRSLQTRLTVLPLDAALLPRAAELASRVNQFLLTGFRPNALQLAARPQKFDFMVRLDDAFGAHGLVGLVLASRQGEDLVLDNLFLSCRALQRGVEGAMLHVLAKRAEAAGLTRILGRIEQLPRNEPARGVLAAHGFAERDGAWIYDLAAGPLAVVPEGLALTDAPGEFS